VTSLSLDAPGGLKIFQPLEFAFTVKNVSSGGASIKELRVPIRGPAGDGLDLRCAGGQGVTLQAGQQWTCNASAATGFGSSGTYTYWADWLDFGDTWHTGELGPMQTFTLQPSEQALATSGALSIDAPGGFKVYQPLTFTFSVRNVSSGGASIKDFRVPIRGPAGDGLDLRCSNGAGVTLLAGQDWTCTASATTGFGSPGTYTYWADWLDFGDKWHTGELGPMRTFTLVATTPSAPSSVVATGGDGIATVSWDAPSDGGSPITGYTVTQSPGGTEVTVGSGTTVAVIDGLTNGTIYTFTVAATNDLGQGPSSSPSPPIVPVGGSRSRLGPHLATIATRVAPPDPPPPTRPRPKPPAH
jgi:hypothetical protein